MRRALRRRYGRARALPRGTLVRHIANDLQARNPGTSRRVVMSWIRGMTDLPMIAYGRGLITRAEYEALGGDPNNAYAGTR